MSAHGISGWRGFFVGTTAEQVLRMAVCPVLTMRQPEENEASDVGDERQAAPGALPAVSDTE